MSIIVSDLFSKELLAKYMIPEFTGYYYRDFKKGFNMPHHSHDNVEILYVNRGTCHVNTCNHKFRMATGDFVTINSNVSHQLLVEENMHCSILCLEFRFISTNSPVNSVKKLYENSSSMRFLFNSPKDLIKLKDTEEIFLLLRSIYSELESGHEGLEISLPAGFSWFMIKMARIYETNEKSTRSSANKYVKEAIKYMKSNYFEEMPMEFLAKRLNINTNYFYRIFKQITGITPVEYLTNIRIEKAKYLLEKSNIPATEVCNYTGFNSSQYFSYIFKKITGFSPSKYREMCKTTKAPATINRLCVESLMKS